MTTTPKPAQGQRTMTVRDIDAVAEIVLARRSSVPTGEAMLVAVSGIDGSGKGHFTSLLTRRLNAHGVSAVGINIDGWLALPDVRLPAAEIVREYEAIYFPAERLHFALDEPRESADVIVVNDPRLEGTRP